MLIPEIWKHLPKSQERVKLASNQTPKSEAHAPSTTTMILHWNKYHTIFCNFPFPLCFHPESQSHYLMPLISPAFHDLQRESNTTTSYPIFVLLCPSYCPLSKWGKSSRLSFSCFVVYDFDSMGFRNPSFCCLTSCLRAFYRKPWGPDRPVKTFRTQHNNSPCWCHSQSLKVQSSLSHWETHCWQTVLIHKDVCVCVYVYNNGLKVIKIYF